MIDALDIHLIWQTGQTILVLAMLAVMWRLHRRLDTLRAAGEEANAWLEQFSKLISRTEHVLKQARTPAPQQATPPTEAKQDETERIADGAQKSPEGSRSRNSEATRRGSQDPAASAKIARLEDILGRLR